MAIDFRWTQPEYQQYGGGFAPDLGGMIWIDGIQQVLQNLDLANIKIRLAAEMVLEQEARRIYSESKYEVPRDTGELAKAGYVHKGTKIAAVFRGTESGGFAGGYGSSYDAPELAQTDYGAGIGASFKTMNAEIPEWSIGYDVSPSGRPYGVYVHEIPPPPESWSSTRSKRHDKYDKAVRKGKGRYRGLDMASIEGGMRYARHQPPTKWHFLSDPFERSMQRFPRDMAVYVQNAVAGLTSVSQVRGSAAKMAPRLRKK